MPALPLLRALSVVARQRIEPLPDVPAIAEFSYKDMEANLGGLRFPKLATRSLRDERECSTPPAQVHSTTDKRRFRCGAEDACHVPIPAVSICSNV